MTKTVQINPVVVPRLGWEPSGVKERVQWFSGEVAGDASAGNLVVQLVLPVGLFRRRQLGFRRAFIRLLDGTLDYARLQLLGADGTVYLVEEAKTPMAAGFTALYQVERDPVIRFRLVETTPGATQVVLTATLPNEDTRPVEVFAEVEVYERDAGKPLLVRVDTSVLE